MSAGFIRRIFPCLAAGMFVAAVYFPNSSFAAGEYDEGNNTYATKCAYCHGETGTGNGPAAPSYGPRPANLTGKKFWKGNPERKITEAVTKGYGTMPRMELGPGQIKALIDYMSHAFNPGK